MGSLDLSGLRASLVEVGTAFFTELVEALGQNLISIAVVGDAAIGVPRGGRLDINSVAILKAIEVRHLRAIAPLGKKHGRKGMAAPFLLTPEVIETSRDVFAVEYLNFRLAHTTIYGPDLLSDIEIEPDHLRLQCERELKGFLLQLRQGFIKTAGDSRLLQDVLTEASRDLFPELRAVLHLLGKPISLSNEKDLQALCEGLDIDGEGVQQVLLSADLPAKPSAEELEGRFSDLYGFIRFVSEKVDAGLG
ncbi:MAG: hypothetical protein O7H41_04905 [Planctomycetota bacterium]|nr:hypothetical protein [Planctomycetota bacterium]